MFQDPYSHQLYSIFCLQLYLVTMQAAQKFHISQFSQPNPKTSEISCWKVLLMCVSWGLLFHLQFYVQLQTYSTIQWFEWVKHFSLVVNHLKATEMQLIKPYYLRYQLSQLISGSTTPSRRFPVLQPVLRY